MKINYSLIVLMSLSICLYTCNKTTTSSDLIVVTFLDANFEQLIRETLAKPSGDIIDTDLATITELQGSEKGITNI